MSELAGILISFLAVFFVLGVVALLKKRGMGDELSRKLVHILLSNWIILALVLFEETWAACIAPACFVLLNTISHYKGTFSAIERKEADTLGTVWYAVSLFILCFAGFSLGMPWIAACGMLAMGYGDGLAALVGMRRGRHPFSGRLAGKSLEGTATVAVFTALSVGGVCAVYAPDIALSAALLCALPAAAIELYSPRGIDNLTLPLLIAAEVFALRLWPGAATVLTGLSLTLLILLAAYYVCAITFWGMQAATLLGVLLYAFGGTLSFGALVLFFVLGSAVSRIGKEKKRRPGSLHQRQGARSVVQVAANGGPALIFAFFHYATQQSIYLLAVLVSFAAATADTFSSEIGMLSRRDPVSIITFKKITRGISGGVTLLGFMGAVLGSGLMALLALPQFGLLGAGAVLLFGVVGSVFDSIMGAVFQAKYHLPTGGLTERRILDGIELRLAQGVAWVTNDLVNFASVLLCSGLCVAVIAL